MVRKMQTQCVFVGLFGFKSIFSDLIPMLLISAQLQLWCCHLRWTLQAVLHGIVWGFSTAQLQVGMAVQGLQTAALESWIC